MRHLRSVMILLIILGALPVLHQVSTRALAATTPLDTFEAGLEGWEPFNGPGSTVALNPVTPGADGTAAALQVDYAIGDWGGLVHIFDTARNWTPYSGMQLWFNGSGTGTQIRLDIHDNATTPGNVPDTAERFSTMLTDDVAGWREIDLPWSAFSRRGDWQPGGAPNDGLTLSEMWGYSLSPLTGTSTFQLDEVLLVSSDTPVLPFIDTYEAPNPDWQTFSGNGGVIDTSLAAGIAGSSLAITYTVPPGGWAGWVHVLPSSQNWFSSTSALYTGLDFWFFGAGGGAQYGLDLHDNASTPGNVPDSAERFHYVLTDDTAGWRHVVLPWSAFQRRADWQPAGAPNDGLTLSEAWGYSLTATSGAGSFRLDQLRLTTRSFYPPLPIVDDFETPRTSWLVFNGPASTVAQTLTAGITASTALQVSYAISDWGGWVHDFPASADWSGYSALTFWIRGSGSGNQIRLDLHDNSPNPANEPDAAERFSFMLTDTSAEWRQLAIAFDAFERADWQPGGAPDDGLTLSQMWGYSFTPISGTGTLLIDDVVLQQGIAQSVQVGAGSYAVGLPTTPSQPVNDPAVTENVAGPVPTHEWWTPLAWHINDSFGREMFPHPLAVRPYADGLGVSYPSTPTISTAGFDSYHYRYDEELRLGVAGLDAPQTEVDGWSDWMVRARWMDATHILTTTLGHGSPFIVAETLGGDPQITTSAAASVWSGTGTSRLGLTVKGHHYGLFAPDGISWSQSGSTLTAPGAAFIVVAALPDNLPATLSFFGQYAYNRITDTAVHWSYDEASATLSTTYSVTTEPLQGAGTDTLLALYRHQWLNSSDALTSYTYASPRGLMKVRAGSSFTTTLHMNGVLPALPLRGDQNTTRLISEVLAISNTADLFEKPAEETYPLDTYWIGKSLGRLATLAPIAEQLDQNAARDRFTSAISNRLERWLTATPGETSELFYYNQPWGTLIGLPQDFGSGPDLNDHHFHYGYFIQGAALVAQYDPAWAASEQWGGMVNLLVRDVSSPRRDDPLFPFLRTFDVYAGHSWASGHGADVNGNGNNQESSSEAMNYAAALILWGTNTNDTALRDLGIYLYLTEASAIEQYWFDVDDAVFPPGFAHTTTGMVWSNGAQYRTWWTNDAEAIHGINFLPVTAGSLYLGRNPAYIEANYNELISRTGGELNYWQDIIWPVYALADADQASAWFEANHGYGVEYGTSLAFTDHWVHALAGLGQLDPTVSASSPTAAVFVRNHVRTYVAYNPAAQPATVLFSDGRRLTVQPRQLASSYTGFAPVVSR